MTKHIFPIVVLLVVSIVISIPFLKPGLFVIHDDQQIARLYLFDKALRSGQFPVRWVDELGFGFGYPLFVFYPPLVYMVGEFFHLLGFGFIDSTKLVFFLSIFASGVAMYVFAREFWGKLPAVVSAIFYMLVPYRAVDIYIRGALAESFSFVWLPLILLFFYKIIQAKKLKHSILSGILLALLMITHNLVFLPFMLLVPFYFLFLIWKSEKKVQMLVHFIFSIILALLLSAFFWLPAILEKKFTIVDQLLLVNLASYKIHFVYLQQLWNWTWGFGGSAPGLADGISFKIGKLHILVSLAALIFSLIHLIKNRKATIVSLATWQRNHFNFQFAILIFFLLIIAAFMTTFYSRLVWDLISPLAYLQFPWRFLIFTALFGSLLSGAFLYCLRLPVLQLFIGVLLIFLLALTNLKLFRPQSYRLGLTDEIATSKQLLNLEISQSSFEYMPKGVELYRSGLGTNLVKIEKDQIPTQKVEITKGEAIISDVNTKPTRVDFSIDAQGPSQLLVNIFNFPGWQAEIDGKKINIDDDNRLKLITLYMPEGLHRVKVEFKNTQIRNLANFLSLASTLFLFVFSTRQWLIRKTR